jgi:cyclohexyl-isocyanide hydratase
MGKQQFVILEVIYPGMTQLDFTAPHTIFSRIPGVRTIVASPAGGEVECDGGLAFAGTAKLAEIEGCDLLFVPGGWTTVTMINDDGFMGEIRRLAAGATYLTSVCTGSLILGAAGLLVGKQAASHWAWREMLRLFGAIPGAERVVRDGNIITGGGVTAGIDFALVVAAELAGETLAQSLQLGIEYAPAPPFDSGRPDLAAPEVMRIIEKRFETVMPAQWEQARAAAGRMS